MILRRADLKLMKARLKLLKSAANEVRYLSSIGKHRLRVKRDHLSVVSMKKLEKNLSFLRFDYEFLL